MEKATIVETLRAEARALREHADSLESIADSLDTDATVFVTKNEPPKLPVSAPIRETRGRDLVDRMLRD